jgi:hypothetical protein
MFILSFFLLLCVFSLHNINSDVYFPSSVLSSYTFVPKFEVFLYAFSPQFSSLLFQVFFPPLDTEILHFCLFITSTTVFSLLIQVINRFSSFDNVTARDPCHKIFSPSTFKGRSRLSRPEPKANRSPPCSTSAAFFYMYFTFISSWLVA